MAELPQRGPYVEHRASNIDQPLNKAAFDPNDRDMLRRIDAPQPEPAMPAAYPDAGTGLDRVMLYDDPDDIYRTPTTPGLLDGQRPRRTRFTV